MAQQTKVTVISETIIIILRFTFFISLFNIDFEDTKPNNLKNDIIFDIL